MKLNPILLVCFLFVPVVTSLADPLLSSWYTAPSGRYARIYVSDAAKAADTPSTTWSRGRGVQSLPVYAGVSEISYSEDWVYLRTSGLGYHTMGPWYLDVARRQNFPNFPANTATLYRLPRAPSSPAAKVLTGLGAIGYFVDGVAMFDNRDGFSYSNSAGRDASPVNGITGDGVWTRDAYVNEGVTFDAALAHQAGKQYHYHANPPALRYELGDHVDYDAATKSYAESTGSPSHSPILGWVRDGYPIYGPYGYGSPLDASSGVRRMVSGYVKRDGANGTSNLAVTGRTTLPGWAAKAQGRSVALSSDTYGPATNAEYPIGHYAEDYDYLGDLGYTLGDAFDLDLHNGRFCVTPEFPEGTYAYFVAIEASGVPKFPYNLGRWFYGNPTGGAVTTIGETTILWFRGGPAKSETWADPALTTDEDGGVKLTWSAIEGGTYLIEASGDLSNWAAAGTVSAVTEAAFFVEPGIMASELRRFYRVNRQSLADYDDAGFDTTIAAVP